MNAQAHVSARAELTDLMNRYACLPNLDLLGDLRVVQR
jgi:hypothetical protein